MSWTTEWQQEAQVAKGVEVYRGNVQTAWIPQEATIVSATDQGAPRAAAKLAGVAGFRAAQSGAMSGGVIQNQMTPIFREIGRVINAPEAKSDNDDVSLVLGRIRRYMIDNPDALSPPPRVASLQFVNPASPTTPAPGFPAPVGTGTALLLLVDEDGFPLESRVPDTVIFECTDDRQAGVFAGQEKFQLRGLPFDDAIDLYQSGKGSGQILPGISALSADTSGNVLGNPSFSVVNGTISSLTSIDSWDVVTGTISMFQIDQVNFYRAANLEGTTPGSLKVTPGGGSTAAWRQKFSANQTSLDTRRPYFLQVAFNAAVNGATGTLSLKLGSQTVSVVVDGLAGWQILKLPLDKNLYFKNFDTDDAEIRLTFAATNGAALLVDDVVFGNWTGFGGIFYAFVGSGTPFKFRDSGQWVFTMGTSSSGIPGRIQRTVGRGYGSELPTALPAVNPAPGAPVATLILDGTGVVDAGAHEYVAAVKSPTATGGITGYVSVISNVVVNDGTHTKNSVLLPTLIGLTGYTIDLFRSKAGLPGTWYLQSTGNASGATVTDSSSDASLGAQPTFKSAATQPQDV